MIEVEIHIPGIPPKDIWEYLTRQEHIAKWWGMEVELQAFKGGSFYEPWTDESGNPRVSSGRVTALEENMRLQLDWKDDDWDKTTRVEFLLHLSNGGTDLLIQHSGWDIIDDKKRVSIVDHYQDGWLDLMTRFKKYCLEQRV